MKHEVEVKVRHPGDEKLEALNPKYLKTVRQVDTYLRHPCRDFRETDEAFRIRDEDGNLYVTYKGPRLDGETKTRLEYEHPVDGDFSRMLEALGFTAAAVVKKTRRLYEHGKYSICIDDVDGLGLYMEIETDDLDHREEIFRMLGQLGLGRKDSITESYLELLEKRLKADEK